jgi:signal transduction histidine kinase
VRSLFDMLNTKLDTSASMEDALMQRLRRGVRMSAIVGTSLVLVLFVLDLAWPGGSGFVYNASRVAVGLAMAVALIVATRARSQRAVSIAAVLLSLSIIMHALVNIGSSGGANSSLLPLFPLCVMVMTYTVPMSLARVLIIYPLLFLLYVAVIFGYSDGATTEAQMRALRWGALTICYSMGGAWLSYRVLRDTFDWRTALREESRRAALALERTRIARDLHDHVGARLTGIALRAEREQKRAPEQAKDALVWIQDTIRLCLEELRDTIWALSSSGRDSRELVATLRRRAEDIVDAAAMTLEWQIDASKWHGQLSAGVSVALSAIVREALTNTLRHSGARTVRIALDRDEREIRLEIADDGQGLGQTPSEGRGLGNMRTRAKEQNGDVRLEQNGERGVRVVATIPIPRERAGEQE